MARRRKEERRAGSASRGMRSDEVVAPPVRGHRRALLAMWCLSRATPRGQPWTPAVTLPHGRNGLSVRRMAVLSTFREPSLCRQVHREFMRNAVLDLTPIIPATACHQRNYIERYSRFNWIETTALPPKNYTDGAHVRGKASTLPGVAERICQHALHLRPLGHSCHYGCTDAVRHSVSVRILQALMPNP
jgi:hypothetical protein